jgi:DNA polymerase-1
VADVAEAISLIENFLRDLHQTLEADKLVVAISDQTTNCFRLDYDGSYKAPRANVQKPVAYGALREYFLTAWAAKIVPRLEADDVLGIWATHPTLIPGERIIVSIDKDFQCVPCQLYNPDKPQIGVRTISTAEADYYHMYQTLIGDRVDNYTGCHGVGPITAERILNEATQSSQTLWSAVATTFASRIPQDTEGDHDELAYSAALRQARLARILRHTDFDFDRRVVIDWNPDVEEVTHV